MKELMKQFHFCRLYIPQLDHDLSSEGLTHYCPVFFIPPEIFRGYKKGTPGIGQ